MIFYVLNIVLIVILVSIIPIEGNDKTHFSHEKSPEGLEELEKELMQSDEDTLLRDVSPETIHLETPAACGDLKECQLRLVHENDLEASHVHVVARQASDNSLVYTDTVMVRMLTA